MTAVVGGKYPREAVYTLDRSSIMMLSGNMPLALTDTHLDRPVPVLDNLIKPHFELTGKGRASPAFSNLSKLDLELAGKDRPMPVSGDLLELVVELAGKGLSIFGATEKDTPVFGIYCPLNETEKNTLLEVNP